MLPSFVSHSPSTGSTPAVWMEKSVGEKAFPLPYSDMCGYVSSSIFYVQRLFAPTELRKALLLSGVMVKC